MTSHDSDAIPPTDPPPRRWPISWGVTLGLLAVLVYLPITFKLRQQFDVPIPNPTPREERAEPVDIARSYWASWAMSGLGLLVPGIAMSAFPRGRRAAVGYLIVALTAGGLLAFITISFEINGFAPNGYP